MVHPAAVAPAAAAKHQGGDRRAIGQIIVVPVIDAGPDDDHRATLGHLGIGGELARQPGDRLAADAGVFLLPGGGIRRFDVIILRIIARQAAAHAELGVQEIEDCGHRDSPFICLDVSDRHTALIGLALEELIERHLHDLIMFLQEAEPGGERAVVQPILQLEVPLAFLLLPAEAHRPFGHARLVALLVPDEQFPVAIFRALIALQAIGAQEAACPIALLLRLQGHQEGSIAVFLEIIHEIGHLTLGVELF